MRMEAIILESERYLKGPEMFICKDLPIEYDLEELEKIVRLLKKLYKKERDK